MKRTAFKFRRSAVVLALASSFALISTNVMALPQGGVVAAGIASIASKGTAMMVSQSSNSATYNWQSFNIGQTESVHFQQPNANSVALNYVLGNSNSIIDGRLSSNGQLFLSNPNGILFGATAQVNVAGLTLDAGKSSLANAGNINVNGGSLIANAGIINNTGIIEASHAIQVGGKIVLTANNGVINTGSLLANGTTGGSVLLTAGTSVLQMGTVQVNGATGAGGGLDYRAADAILLTQAARDLANGATRGGMIHLQGNNNLFTSSTFSATGQQGGTIDLLGSQVTLAAAQVDASGTSQGGLIRVGGDFHGTNPAILNAQNTVMNGTTNLKANGGLGKIVVWSDKQTNYYGNISADLAGNIEVSSKGTLNYAGTAKAGVGGTLLLDPANIVISAAASPSYFALQDPHLLDPHPAAGTLIGSKVTALSITSNGTTTTTGKAVVAVPTDSLVATNAGTVYLFDTTSGALISTLTGLTPGDQLGSGGVTALSNGNFVINSPNWGSAGLASAGLGAVTWGNGVTGVSGSVSSSNSLVGSLAGHEVGIGGITALKNGNYVVNSYNWDNGAAVNAGAVTWGNGSSGVVGIISATNSLVSSTANDTVGVGGITVLNNGNYVVNSYNWDNGAAVNAGAVTWGNGTTGTSGIVSAVNSLVGTKSADQVGLGGLGKIMALSNGNYVVTSPYWGNGAATQAGAVTWGNGTGGTVGAVSASNSLVGSTTGDQVGFGGATQLTNGNYFVTSWTWHNGAAVSAGAVTWGNGATGISGLVSAANSLVGTQSGDQVGLGGSAALTNGNYVVVSPYWNGLATQAGAVTWGNGTSGTVGAISTSNSLVGTTLSDRLGIGGVTPLNNGNYVVKSPYWGGSNGTGNGLGAATWGNGLGGTVGAVSAANSLVGTTIGDNVSNGGVTALTNGNYVVDSLWWKNGAATFAGAVTWGDGTKGVVGPVSAINSLVGTTAGDSVSNGVIVALNNGNYVVSSPWWNNGIATHAGAVTWANGTTGISGAVSASNSLVGTSINDTIGSAITTLADGNYVVTSVDWGGNGVTGTGLGAVTWGYAGKGAVGAISAANSLIGVAAGDRIGSGGINALSDGSFLILSPNYAGTHGQVAVGAAPKIQNVSFASNLGQTLALAPSSVTSTLASGTAVTLQASNDITVDSAISVAGNTGGSLTLQAGRSILLNAGINTANGNLTLIANDLVANGVVAADRAAGIATISQNAGTLNTGTGLLTIAMRNGGKGSGIVLGNIVAGNLNVTSKMGVLSQALNSTLNVAGASTLAADNGLAIGNRKYDIILDNAGNNFGGAVHLTASGATLSDSVGGLTFGNLNLGTGGLIATSENGAISQAAGTTIRLAGDTTLAADNGLAVGNVKYGISLINAGNDFVGNVSTTGTTVGLSDSIGGLVLGNVSASTLTATSRGGILTQALGSSILVGGGSNLIADNGVLGAGNIRYGINLTGSTNNFTGVVTATGNGISLNDMNALNTVLTDSGSSVLNAGGALVVSGTATGGLTATTTGAASNISFGNTTVGGALNVTSGGVINQNGVLTNTLTVNGASALNAVSNINLSNASNNFVGTVAATAGGQTLLTDINALTASLNSTGLTTLKAGGTLVVSGTATGGLTTTTTGVGSTTTFGNTTVAAAGTPLLGTLLNVTSTGAVARATPATVLTVAGTGTSTPNSRVMVNGVAGVIIP